MVVLSKTHPFSSNSRRLTSHMRHSPFNIHVWITFLCPSHVPVLFDVQWEVDLFVESCTLSYHRPSEFEKFLQGETWKASIFDNAGFLYAIYRSKYVSPSTWPSKLRGSSLCATIMNSAYWHKHSVSKIENPGFHSLICGNRPALSPLWHYST